MRRKVRKIKIIILILFLFAGFIIVSKNTRLSTATDYYIATANLNIRTGTGNEYPISFTLQKGEEVEIISKKYNWYEIKYLEKTGYAYSKYLKYSKTVSNTNVSDTLRGTYQQTILHIVIGIFVIIIFVVGFSIFRKIRDKKLLKTVTQLNRGTPSERDLVLKLLKCGVLPEMIFHDIYLQKDNGTFSQIDLVVATTVGIIVFEVKDYSGWIFGTGYKSQWTKVLAYGKEKYRFYNPIMQNNKHIEDLRKKLTQFENVPFYSVVVFYGDCVLKDISFVPNGTFLVKSNRVLEVLKMIMKNNEPVQYANKNEIFRKLKDAVINGENREIQNQHIENIKDMLGKDRIFD
ncbi:MAG: NERD domain-containing protein [Bacteroidetes bacterium]|nr:NERD domain-containing protein [Bacteroidota bacterium]MCL1969631.1 NERD domain-containing protein [Bacteroidota bacterium]